MFTVITVGRLMPWKGNNTVIEAVQELSMVNLQIVGDGPEMENLKKIATNETKFFGTLSHEDTKHKIIHADLLVLNSGYEGYSHTLLEAIQLHTPIAFSYCTGNIEMYDESNEQLKNSKLVQKFELNNKNEIKQCIVNVKNIYGEKDFTILPCDFCAK